MYIVKCDRCGKEKEVKGIFPGIGSEPLAYAPRYMISEFGQDGGRTICLCKDCEQALDSFLERDSIVSQNENMRDKLFAFCETRKQCSTCPLHVDELKCGRGKSWLPDDDLTTEEISLGYSLMKKWQKESRQ